MPVSEPQRGPRWRATVRVMKSRRRSTIPVPVYSALVVVAVALAGCAPASTAAQAPPTPSAMAPAAPVSAPAAEVPPAPTRILGGDCSALFPDTVVSDVLGTTVTARSIFLDSPNAHAVSTLGGLSCEWSVPAGAEAAAGAASVSAVLLSSAVAGAETESVTCYTGAITATNDDASACRFSVIDGTAWLSGVVYAPTGTAQNDIRAAVARLADVFRAVPSGEVTLPALPATAWLPSGCADLSDAADVAATLRSPDLVGSDVAIDGPDSAPGLPAANAGAGTFACAWHTSGTVQNGTEPIGQLDGFSIQGLPGGAWVQAQVMAQPGATIVDVPGADLAVRVPTAVGHEMLDVFDGVNWLQIARADSLDPILPVLPALLDTLNAATVESSK